MAFFKHDGHHRQIAILIGMNKMALQRIRFTLDQVFTGGMEMELFQTILHAINHHVAAGIVHDLYGMAVVQDLAAACFIVEFQRFQISFDKTGQVDRGLIFTGAGTEFRCQFRPVFRAGFTVVTPVGMMFSGECGEGGKQHGCTKQILFHSVDPELINTERQIKNAPKGVAV